jgi:hypothetical protein
MLSPQAPSPHRAYFHVETKCCTHVPLIPNFLVGNLLADDDPAMAAGRASVEARVASGQAVWPIGLGRTAAQNALYRETLAPNETLFGRERSMRCPHYIAGDCGIWKHRPAMCATWFCKHERGAAGLGFWQSVRSLFEVVERALARWCVLEIAGDDDELLAHAFGDDTAAAWGSWTGRERELYRACADRVATLSWDQIVAICGVEVRGHQQLARHRREPGRPVPSRLRPAALRVLSLTEERCTTITYSPFDPIEMPRALFDVLSEFDGRPTDDVLAALQERGIELPLDVLRKLVDFAVLARA